MITRETDYAIRAVLFLSKHSDELISTAELAEAMHIPYRFLRKIAKKLSEAGIIKSFKGKSGGLKLNRNTEDISILDIINLMSDKGVQVNQCLSSDKNCEFSNECPVHKELDSVQNLIKEKLQEITFNKL